MIIRANYSPTHQRQPGHAQLRRTSKIFAQFDLWWYTHSTQIPQGNGSSWVYPTQRRNKVRFLPQSNCLNHFTYPCTTMSSTIVERTSRVRSTPIATTFMRWERPFVAKEKIWLVYIRSMFAGRFFLIEECHSIS